MINNKKFIRIIIKTILLKMSYYLRFNFNDFFKNFSINIHKNYLYYIFINKEMEK